MIEAITTMNLIPIIGVETKHCNKCGVPKILGDFPKRPDTLGGRGHICKTCVDSYQRKWHKANPNIVHAYEHKNWVTRKRPTIEASFEGFLRPKIRSCKNRSKVNKLPFDIDFDYIMKLLVQQKYTCALTGLEMNHTTSSMQSVSIDKIIGPLGYVKGNIQLVTLGAQYLKLDFSDAEAREFIAKLRISA